MLSDDELLTIKELASYLKVKRGSLYPKVRKGEVPAFKLFNETIKAKQEIQIQQPVEASS